MDNCAGENKVPEQHFIFYQLSEKGLLFTFTSHAHHCLMSAEWSLLAVWPPFLLFCHVFVFTSFLYFSAPCDRPMTDEVYEQHGGVATPLVFAKFAVSKSISILVQGKLRQCFLHALWGSRPGVWCLWPMAVRPFITLLPLAHWFLTLLRLSFIGLLTRRSICGQPSIEVWPEIRGVNNNSSHSVTFPSVLLTHSCYCKTSETEFSASFSVKIF